MGSTRIGRRRVVKANVNAYWELMVSERDVKGWIQTTGPRVLRNVGLRSGQVVADLGCRLGHISLPAARVVGEAGAVYALDRDTDALENLSRRAARMGLANVQPVVADLLEGPLPLLRRSVDAVILFDVVHGVYFPDAKQRRDLFDKVRWVLRPDGWLAIYPTHARRHGPPLHLLQREITQTGFIEVDRAYRRLLHDERPVRGWVLVYRRADKQIGRAHV